MAAPSGTILRHIRSMLVTEATRDMSDGDLLGRFVAGREQHAFAALMQRHAALVWSVCRRILPHEHDTEDAFQATFLVLARKADSIRKGGSVGSWLFGVAHRIAMKAKQAAARRLARESRAETSTPAQPVTEAALRELQGRLDAEVERLPEKYRAPFVLCCLEGKSRSEAAAALGWNISTLSTRLTRARGQLQRRLARRGVRLSAALAALALAESAMGAGVPARLVSTTLNGVLLSAAGAPVTGVVSPQAAALAKGLLHSMFLGKLKVTIAFLLALTVVVGGGLVARHGLVASETRPNTDGKPKADTPKPSQPDAGKKEKPAIDSAGDPLPRGALDRLGTARLRHGAAARCVAYSSDGKLLVSGGADWLIRIWDPVSGKELRRLANPSGPLLSLAISPDGRLLAAAGEQKDKQAVHLWDLTNGKELKPVPTPRGTGVAVAFSPSSKLLAIATQEGAVSLWDVASGKEKARFAGHANGTSSVAFDPDGKTLISGGADRTVRQWDLATGNEKRTFEGHGDRVTCVAFARDGKTVASASLDRSIRLWDAATGRLLHMLNVPAGAVLSVAFSRDSKRVVSGGLDGAASVWETATSRLVRSISGSNGSINSVAFAPDGTTVAAAGIDYQVRIFKVATGKEVHRLNGHRGPVHGLAFTRDGKLLASGGHDRALAVWNVAARKELLHVGAHTAGLEEVAFAPDGLTLASVAWDGTLALWDTATGKQRLRIPAAQAGVFHCVAFSPDGRFLALGGRDGSVVLYDPATGREVRRLVGHKARLGSLAFSPDGKLLVSGGFDQTARVWAVESGKELYTLTGIVTARSKIVALSPDGRTIAAPMEDGTLRFWELATGKERGRIAVKDSFVSLAFAPDSRRLAGSVASVAIRVWDLSTGRQVGNFAGNANWTQVLCFAPDGRTLAGGSANSTVLLWDFSRLKTDKPAGPVPLTLERLRAEWDALIGDDSGKAYRALWALTAAPRQAIPLLEKHLQPSAAPDEAKRIEKLIADLDSDSFRVRQQAMTALEKLGPRAEPILLKVLQNNPPPEVRGRVQQLLARLKSGLPSADHCQKLRILEALEQIGSPEARQVLKKTAASQADAWLAKEAQASLDRLTLRP
jgi:RNA polymerase sigma factor (sigma-70 family)